MKITKNELLEKYNTLTDNILDECDWKTHFTSKEICGLVHNIIKNNDKEPNVSPEELHKIYSKKLYELNISKDEWVEKYGVPEIIAMIYEILENHELKLDLL